MQAVMSVLLLAVSDTDQWTRSVQAVMSVLLLAVSDTDHRSVDMFNATCRY